MEDFNKRLKLLRKKLGEKKGKKRFIQSEMAQLVGVDKQTWWRYENTSRSPDADVLQKLVQSVNLNPLWLLTGEGEMFVDQCKECEIKGVPEASAPYGLTLKGREILELLRENPEDEDLILRLLKGKKAVKESLAGLQRDLDPSEAQD
jgi:transcriptional regulator with XRE-family HTH domain